MTSNDVSPYYEEKRKRLATPILKLTLTTLVSRLVWRRCVWRTLVCIKRHQRSACYAQEV